MKRPESTPLLPEDATAPSSQSTHGTEARSQLAVPALSPAVQKHIGNLLKVSYQELLTEAVPDRFANLLEQLEQAEKKGK